MCCIDGDMEWVCCRHQRLILVAGRVVDNVDDIFRFDGADLPVWWDRIVNKDHYGRCFVFPLLMRHILSWSPVNNTVDEHGELQELPRTLVEKILVQCTTDAVRI